MSLIAYLPRYPLAQLPTPLQPLPRLSALLADQGLQAEIWIKRDDQTGLALGGNKTRKLEFLLADALSHGADTLITTGAVQSNHCRQTAAAAVQAGLACHLVLGLASGETQPPAAPNGNLLLDLLLGATLHWTARNNRINRLRELEAELRAEGKRPYFITYGGSDPIGAVGYALAMEEMLDQAREAHARFDVIVAPSSSGGTQAGLATGAWALGSGTRILGISIDEPQERLQEHVANLASDTSLHAGLAHAFLPDEIEVDANYLGAGYGVVGDLEREAIRIMAQTEGILLDPVYTGRAFGGLLDILRTHPESLTTDDRPPRILFWHTGGAPALFAYADTLRSLE